jgi:cardiolipin synthase A/B
MTFLNNPFDVIWVLSWLGALLTVPSILLQRAGRPTAALSWILALFALPVVTLLAWWLFGRIHLRRKRRSRRQASAETAELLIQTKHHLLQTGQIASDIEQPAFRLAPHLPSMLRDAVFPATAGNAVHLLLDTAQAHQAWRGLIQNAYHHLHLLFYIWRNDCIGRSLLNALIEKAKQGVEVRVLIDTVGSWTLPHNFFDDLVAVGGRLARFMPIRLTSAMPTLNFRNHRKLLIADGRQAFTGSINIGDEYLDWQDLGIIIQGPGVNQLQEVFVDDWQFTTGEELVDDRYFCNSPDSTLGMEHGAVCETIASGPDQDFNATRELIFLAITQCHQRLWITTPYFVPDEALVLALRTAVYRGVDVRLILPDRSDTWLVRRASRAFYPELLQAGVSVFEYQGMLHAKAMLLDEDRVLIGSANLDTRSFRLNFELSTAISDPRVNRELATLLKRIQTRSVQISLADLQLSSTTARLQDALAHLMSPLL